MEIPKWLVRVPKSGSVAISSRGQRSLEIKIENANITVDLLDTELMRRLMPTKELGKDSSIFDKLSKLKGMSEQLKDSGLTVTLSNRGKRVLRLGAAAKPRLMRALTFSGAIEVTGLRELRRLSKDLGPK